MKVVLDTNVFVSSFFGGNPKKIIDLWKNGKITLCVSDKILDEYVSVLTRLGLDTKAVEELLALFKKGFNMEFAFKTPELHVVEADPEDNKFIECAVALKCFYIVSGDKHLKNIKSYKGIKILSPKEFLELFESLPYCK